MPTVGCEADAIAFTEERSNSSSSTAAASGESSTVLVARADGSYSAGESHAIVVLDVLT